jgi:D-xylose transport system permease protein
VKANVRAYTLIFALIVIWLIFGYLTNGIFFSPRNLSNLFRQMTIISFLAIGMVLVIVSGNIDLSVGSVTGFVSILAAYIQAIVLRNLLPNIFPNFSDELLGYINTIVVIISSMIIALIVYTFQGYIVAYLRVPAFIVTLGGMLIFRGGVLAVTKGRTIVPIEDSLRLIAQGYFPKTLGLILAGIAVIYIFIAILRKRYKKKEYGFSLKSLINDLLKATFFSAIVMGYVIVVNSYLGVPNPVLLMAIIALIFTYLATNTRFGRYIYSIGGNKEAARFTGINIQKNTFKVLLLMGVLCGVAGVVQTGYVAAGTTSGGTGYELSAIAACIIGGTSLVGGEGTIIGALVGALIMTSLENGMSVMNMGFYWQSVMKGLVLIFAVYVDVAYKTGND